MSKEEQKARELVESLHKEIGSMYSGYWEVAKSQAIICVDEILEITKTKKHFWNRTTLQYKWVYSEYWLKVKEQIKSI